MSSSYAVSPSDLINGASQARAYEPLSEAAPHETAQPRDQLEHIADAGHLSPFYSSQSQYTSTSASPEANDSSNQPIDSFASLDAQYLATDFDSFGNDPFFGTNFIDPESGTPSFLEDQFVNLSESQELSSRLPAAHLGSGLKSQHLISPDLTPSLRETSPQAIANQAGSTKASASLGSINANQQSSQLLNWAPSQQNFPGDAYQLTPETSGSNHNSDDGLGASDTALTSGKQSIESHWEQGKRRASSLSSSAANPQSHVASGGLGSNAAFNAAPDFGPYEDSTATMKDSSTHDQHGQRLPDPVTGSQGVGPDERTDVAVESVNDAFDRRVLEERNRDVDDWLSRAATIPLNPDAPAQPPRIDTSGLNGESNGIPDREIELGHQTENKIISGQTYYQDNVEGGPLTEEDRLLMKQNRNWEDAPQLFPISQVDETPAQPDSSAKAIARFNAMCEENDGISRVATWGTRRRSLPSISDADIEGITSGSYLKKLSLSRGDSKRPSFIKEMFGRVSGSGSALKRGRSSQDNEAGNEASTRADAQASGTSGSPPRRSHSGKKNTPSVGTALAMLGTNAASIGTTHTRSASVSIALTSPKHPFAALPVKRASGRPRAATQLPKDPSGSSLADLLKKELRGPPAIQLPNTTALTADDDDEDDDDLFDGADLKREVDETIDDVTPNFAGFKEHLLRLAPLLATTNTHLVDRIAHQQTIRFKHLLGSKLQHLQQTTIGPCRNTSLCIAKGGQVVYPADSQPLDPLSAHLDDSEGGSPLEGAISKESFPADIPMPPATSLPAEFECQLCYQTKSFQKPSDWTKHVHEDVQPFTCTWDRCRDPKIFKRKADWVRHENEGHRHLEWWTCDVDDCRHRCFRRDNFLQHLVREHKYPEPKIKTKAALKKAAQLDPTWQVVERCHGENPTRPQDEPCKFCGKTFPTWKKLTVHLAKHMEQISLPVLRLVARKQLDPDTIISPVHDPPPRAPFAALPSAVPIKMEHSSYNTTPNVAQAPMLGGPMNAMGYGLENPATGFVYTMGVQQQTFHTPYYGTPSFDGLSPEMHSAPQMNMPPYSVASANANSQAFNSQQHIAVSGPNYLAPQPGYTMGPTTTGAEPFPALAMDMNALGVFDQPVAYDSAMINHHSVSSSEHLSPPQDSTSPYNHSPHQNPGAFYSQ